MRGRVERYLLVSLSVQCCVPHSRQWVRGQAELDLISQDIICRHVIWDIFMFNKAGIFYYSLTYLMTTRLPIMVALYASIE